MGNELDSQANTGGWRTRPIFVSGTFRDMHVERDALATKVFPALQEALLPLRTYLERVDLRVGVETKDLKGDHPKQMLVLQVCLDEVRRSRPFLVILLGDRYGWVPPRECMDKATTEAGYATETAGKSVTALEVEFGIWGQREQRTRSFFYFRKLPYAIMDEQSRVDYSDEYAAKAGLDGAADRWKRLLELKAQLRTDETTHDRCREYEVGWDPIEKKVTGTDAGLVARVIADLRPALEAEAREHLAKVEAGRLPSELELFVSERAHGFVGRQPLLHRLMTEALAHGDAQVRSVCLTGLSGSGKSAVFARLHQELSCKNIWLLSHAAGISPDSGRVDSALSGWIASLSEHLGVTNPLAPTNATDAVEAKKPPMEEVFAELLLRASSKQRIVILVDALDRFERTNRGRYVTWMPNAWPTNVRFLATTIAGDESQVLGKRPDTRVEELALLDKPEAHALAEAVYARYHRAPNREAVAALMAKTTSDGRASAGIPLWLVSAVEELNLLDREAFLRADREFNTLAQDAQLPALVLRMAQHETPTDLAELLAKTLERAERYYGTALTRAFATLLAFGRGGWRERDLAALVPAVVPLLFPNGAPADWEGWSPLAFAALRRSFRAHLVRRGDEDRWDFFHLQMRDAAGKTVLADAALCQRVHKAIADHLLGLRGDDPLFESESMYHLIQADDQPRAARFYAEAPLPRRRDQATLDLANHAKTEPGTTWVADLTNTPGLADQAKVRLCQRLLMDLWTPLQQGGELAPLERISNRTRDVLRQMVAVAPNRVDLLLAFSAACDRIGEVHQARGQADAALAAFYEGLEIRRRLLATDPKRPGWLFALSTSLDRVGKVRYAQGQLDAALTAFDEGLEIRRGLIATTPKFNAAFGLDDLYSRELTVSLNNVGDIRLAHEQIDAAFAAFQEGLDIRRRLLAADPDRTDWLRDLCVSLGKVGDVQEARGQIEAASAAFQESLDIRRRILAADPNCADNRYYLANSLQQVGDIQQARGQQAAALDTCREGLEICKQLLSIDSNRPVWLEARAFFLGRLGQIHAARGLRTSATALFQEGLEIARRMVTLEPNRTDFLYALSVSLTQVGDALAEQGERDAALALLQESIELNRRLVTAAPEKLKSLRALNISLNKVGGVLAARGERDAALVSFQEGLDVARRLVTANPHNLDRLRDLAISLGNVANVHQVAGRMDLAFALSQENIDIFRRLLAAHPDRPDCLRDLGVTLSASGRIQKANGQMDGALSSFQQGLEICRRLHSTAPQHPERLRDLMILLVDVGDIHEALGLMGPALAYFEEGLETSKRLLATDPDEPQWMYEVLNMLAIIARVVERVGKTSEAADYWFEANEILSSLPRETRLLPWWRPFYQQTQQNLLRLSTIAGAGNVSATNSTPVGNRAADTRYEYELTAWKALPFWRRLVKKRPKPPEKPGLSLSQSQIDESTAPIVADLATIGMLLGTSAADLRILHDLISPDPGDVPGPHAEQSALRGGQTDRQHSQPRQSLTATDPEASPSPPPGRVSGSSAGSSSNEAHGAAGALVRTDGVYHCQHADYSSYVRFLADGFALTVSSSGTPHQVARWLTLDHDQVSRGRYSVDGTRVTFSSTSSNGTVHYEGEFTITGVDLRSVSRINGHHGTETYVFVPVPKPFE